MGTNVALNAKATKIENKIIDTTELICTPEFNRLSKILFNTRIKEEIKILPSKSQLDAVLDIADKNEEKNSNVWFKNFLMVEDAFVVMDYIIAWHFNQFLILSEYGMVILKSNTNPSMEVQRIVRWKQ